MAGLMEMLGGLIGGDIKNKKALNQAKMDRQRQFAVMGATNQQPMYASENTPTYQRSQSPEASAYLQSFLAGNNPASTFSGSPNAKFVKQDQQASKDQMFGNPQQLQQRGDEYRAQTPWKVTAPTQQVGTGGRDGDGGMWAASHPQAAADGMTKATWDKGVAAGIIKEGTQGVSKAQWKRLQAAGLVGDRPDNSWEF